MPAPTTEPVTTILRAVSRSALFAPERRYALQRVRALGHEPPPEWLAPLLLPAAWHLVQVALTHDEQAVVLRGAHNDDNHFDIHVVGADDMASMDLTWTSGAFHTSGTDGVGSYLPATILRRAAVERRVARAFEGGHAGDRRRVDAASLIAWLTDSPMWLTMLDPTGDPAHPAVFRFGHGDVELVRCDLGSGEVVAVRSGRLWSAQERADFTGALPADRERIARAFVGPLPGVGSAQKTEQRA